jgi:uncharacterized RDD family membrane protein YckC
MLLTRMKALFSHFNRLLSPPSRCNYFWKNRQKLAVGTVSAVTALTGSPGKIGLGSGEKDMNAASTGSLAANNTGWANPVYAGFWLRLIAWFIDMCIIAIPGIVLASFGTLVIAGTLSESEASIGGLVSLATYVLVYYGTLIAYFAGFESSELQATPGKLALGLIVTDLNGNRLTVGRALGRNSGKILSDLTSWGFCIGYLLVAFTERKQALHDLISHSLVVHKER